MLEQALKYGIKAAGAVGVGMVLYDAHKEGVRKADIEVRKGNANAALDWYDNSRNLTSPSRINMRLKDKLFNWEITHNLRAFVNTGIGYVKGFAGMLTEDVIPMGLSIAAIATKGTAAKVTGAALGAYSVFAFAKNVLGIGAETKNFSNKPI